MIQKIATACCSFLLAIIIPVTALHAEKAHTVADSESSDAVVITIEDALRIGLERNFGVILAANEAEIARLNRNFGAAGMTPDLDVQLGFSGGREDLLETVNGVELPQSRTRRSITDVDAALSWTIFDGLRMFTTYERLGELERLGATHARIQIENTVADIIAAYYNIVRVNRRLAVLENTVEISEERYRIADTKRQLGSGSEYELLLARTDLNSDRAAVIQEEVLLSDARLRLLQLLALEPDTDFIIEPEITFTQTLSIDEVTAGINEYNSVLQAADIQRRIAGLQRRELVQGRLPQVRLSAGYNSNNRETNNGTRSLQEVDGYRYGVTVSVPVFDGFNLNRRLQAARIAERSADVRYEEQMLLLRNIATAEYRNYRNTKQVVAIEQENLALAYETLEIALERFTLGTSTSLELRESQRTLINTETRLVTAQYEAKLSETELLRLMGRLQ
ncbi:MAG: TolC family protein [Bacteroidetes bacterium]|nr:TolC family protein [Bacteroidota bacterium]MCH8523302.1 TolC family protein [Balneolales bacterium]